MREFKYIIFLLLISSFSSLSQNNQFDYSMSSDSALHTYKKEMHYDFDYVIGVEYKIYHNYKQDNPYLKSRHGKGTIYSNGYVYDNKVIIYDMYKDIVVVNTTSKKSSNINIQLQKIRIDSFSIEFEKDKYLFRNIKNIEKDKSQISTGFYEIPYGEKFQLLYKHNSEKRESGGITTYTHTIDKLLKIGDTYYNINSRKKFLKLFPANIKQIKKKQRAFETNYNELTTSQLIQLIKFTETL